MTRYVHHQSCNQEDRKRYQERRHRGIKHITDMRKQRRTRYTRSQHSSIAQWRQLITKISTCDDRTGNPAIIKTMCLTDTHQRHTDGSNGSPRRTDHQTHQCTQHTTAHQEHLGADNLHAVIDHRRHNARYHPGSTDGTNQQKDNDSRCTTGYLIRYLFFQILPFQSFGEMAY